MSLLGVTEAKYFCSKFGGTIGSAAGSFRTWSRSLGGSSVITEPSIGYDELRDLSLREVERLIFLAASQYRRSFDLQIASAASWAHVTLYYGTFYAAQALLGMFGAWDLQNQRVLEVVNGTPGSQKFKVVKNLSAGNGSHQRFWDHYYHVVPPLSAGVDPNVRLALQPVLGSAHWLTSTRNDLNYDSFSAIRLVEQHQVRFRRSKFRTTLPGVLATQFQIMEAMLSIVTAFARQFAIAADALSLLTPVGSRRAKMKKLIMEATAKGCESSVRVGLLS